MPRVFSRQGTRKAGQPGLVGQVHPNSRCCCTQFVCFAPPLTRGHTRWPGAMCVAARHFGAVRYHALPHLLAFPSPSAPHVQATAGARAAAAATTGPEAAAQPRVLNKSTERELAGCRHERGDLAILQQLHQGPFTTPWRTHVCHPIPQGTFCHGHMHIVHAHCPTPMMMGVMGLLGWAGAYNPTHPPTHHNHHLITHVAGGLTPGCSAQSLSQCQSQCQSPSPKERLVRRRRGAPPLVSRPAGQPHIR